MKQSLATGRLLILTVALISLLTGCGRIPRNHKSGSASVETATFAAKPTPINLNSASAEELEKLPGVGPVLAERIVNYRKAHGSFRRTEHLLMVDGVSDRKFRELRTLIKVE